MPIVANESMALVCQFIQHTDPRFPLVCFTADSVLLAALTAVIASRWRRAAWLPAVRIRSAVAVLVSAVIFIAVITPRNTDRDSARPGRAHKHRRPREKVAVLTGFPGEPGWA